MVVPLMHPKLLKNLTNFFPYTMGVKVTSAAKDPISGEPVTTDSFLPGIEAIKGTVVSKQPMMEHYSDHVVLRYVNYVYLQGYFPQITQGMHVEVQSTGQRFEILDAQHDSHHVMTTLITEDHTL